jgi:hypothetical protein
MSWLMCFALGFQTAVMIYHFIILPGYKERIEELEKKVEE